MAGNKRPRKAYKPRPAGIPVVIRHTDEAEQQLQLAPHAELLKLREGIADDGSWHSLTCRINICITLAHQNGLQAEKDIAAKGLEAMRQIWARHEKTGKWGASGDDLRAIGDALVTADELQTSMTRRQLKAAVEHVYRVAAV